jgi:hypothetical protein
MPPPSTGNAIDQPPPGRRKVHPYPSAQADGKDEEVRRALMLAISNDESPYSDLEDELVATTGKRIAEFTASKKKKKVSALWQVIDEGRRSALEAIE